ENPSDQEHASRRHHNSHSHRRHPDNIVPVITVP
ncbi:unnamed protein product, partial [Didymodactylos carnosus]